MAKNNGFYKKFDFLKSDDTLGIIFGWGIVCKVNGEEYFDLQDDHIPEDAMLEAVTDFTENSRVIKEMHEEDSKLPGSVVFSFPLTEEIAKAFNVETSTTGWMVGFKPNDPDVLQKFETGEYTGFSIGGVRVEDEEV